MPGQKVASTLKGKLGGKLAKAVEAHKNDETTLGRGGDLPKGIEGGVAQLIECKFDTYKKGENTGEYFFYAAGAVKLPLVHNGIPLKGSRTQIGPEPMCDTPNLTRKTVDEHVAFVLNEFRKLGVDTSDLSPDDFESTAATLKEEGPHFSFRTWAMDKDEIVQKGGKWFVMRSGKQTAGPFPTEAALKKVKPYAGSEPRVNHDWRGICEFMEEEGGEVEDNTADDDTPAEESAEGEAPWDGDNNEEVTKLGARAAKNDIKAQKELSKLARDLGIDPDAIDSWEEVAEQVIAGGSKEEEEGEAEEAAGDEEEAPDFDALGTAADEEQEAGEEGDACGTLRELAGTAELDPDEYSTWTELATALAEAGSEEGGDETEEEAEAEEKLVPKKGQVYFYKAPKSKKAIEVTAMVVYPKGEKADVKQLDDGKTIYKAVPWALLSEE